MYIDIIIIILLIIIFILLLVTLRNTFKKSNSGFDVDIKQMNQNLENLYGKTLEQTGYVNSKIDEIGTLTKKISNAMSSNISDMGEMGEVILENILQDCGMTKNRDYKTQFTDKNENGQIFRPDVVVFLPENRNIIIDSKVPMKDWYVFQNAEDEEIKANSIKNFINALKKHINDISKKNYTNLLKVNSPDYIFMFMPHEFAIITAQKFDENISTFAQQKQIIIVGPSTLIMCMKLVESIWRLEKQNSNSKEIADIAGGMYDQIVKTINLLDKTSESVSKSLVNIDLTKNYIKDGNTSLFKKANKMKDLGASTNQKINKP